MKTIFSKTPSAGIIFYFLLVSFAPAEGQAQAWYNTNWLYRKAITIDYTKVGAGPHTNFPVLISRTDADLQLGALSTGNDILFTSSDGTTKLDHEIESYTSASGTLVAWVEIPSLSSSVNTVIYMYYGNGAATSQQNIPGTWNANFSGVYHLNGVFTDATSNARNGTNSGTVAATGKISSGRAFSRSGQADYITITGLMGSPANVTLSGWGSLNSRDATGAHLVSIGDYISINVDDPVDGYLGAYYDAGWGLTKSSPKLNPAGSGWHYFVYTFDDVANSQVLYMDGQPVGSGSFANPISYTSQGTNTFIGKHANGSSNFDFDGSIDEVRFSNTVRSAGWILTEYNNQNDPSGFYTLGSQLSSAKVFTGTGNFSDAARWTGGILPVAGEDLVIDGACTVDNAAGTDNIAYGTLTIGTATGRTLTWASAGTNRLNVSNVAAGAGASTLNMTNGGTLIIRGTWASTNLTFTSGSGTIEIQSTMTLPAAYATYNNLTINNSAGTVTSAVGTTVNGSLIVSGILQLAGFSMTAGDLQGSGTITSSSGTPTLTIGSNNISTTFSGVIGTGAIALTKNGTGTLTLSGSNTYTGTTTIAAGTLKLGSANSLGTTAGATSVTSGAVLDLNGINYSDAETLTLSGTGISTGGALINSNSTAATYAGNITLSTTTPRITASNPIILSGIISGGNAASINSLTIAGNSTLTGSLTLSGVSANTYTGVTTVIAGAVLKIGKDNALGAFTASSLNNSTVISSGGVVDLNGITYTANEYFELDGTGISGSGAMINSSSTTANFACQFDTWYGGTITADNPIVLSGTVQFNGGTNNDLTKAGASSLTLTSSAGSKGNKLFITAGTVVLGVNNAIGTIGETTISSGAVLDLNGYSSSRPLTSVSGTGISGGGAITNSSTTAATSSGAITLAANASIVGAAGTIAITGTISGAGFGLTLGGAAGGSVTNVISGTSTTITKIDAGTWILSALNTYTGATTVSAGILRATNNTIVASTNGAFGNNASGLFLDGGTIQSNVATFSRPITVTATNSGLDGYGSARTISSAITNATASTSYNLNIGGTTNGVLEGQNLTLEGVIINTPGTLSLTKIGTNTVSFSNQAVTIQNLAINAGSLTSTSATLSVGGNYSNSGTFTHNSGTLNFNGTTVISGTTATNTFNNLTIAAACSATSSTGITGLVVNGTLNTGAGALLDLGTTTVLSGTLGTISNSGTIRTSVITTTSATPIATGKTWGETIEFAAATGAQTVMAGTYTNLKLSNTSGTNAVSGNITVSGILTLTAGTITTGSNTIYLNVTGTVSRTSGHVIGNFKKYIATGATSRTFEIGDATNYTPVTVAFASVTTAGDLTASTASGDHTDVGNSMIVPEKTVNRNWTLTNSGIVFTTYNATFTFVASDLDGGTDPDKFVVGKYSSGWTFPAVGTKTATSTQATNVNAFSDFQLGEVVNLPVTFTSVKASEKNKDILVAWEVAEESDIKKYEIRKSVDGIHFIKAGEVPATGHATIKKYEWLDVNPTGGNHYYYIRAIQTDGSHFLSKTVAVKTNEGTTAINIFPNPVKDRSINIQAGKMQKGKYVVQLTNLQGQSIFYRVFDHAGGFFNQVISTDKIWPAGMYYLRVTSEQEKYIKSIVLN